MVKKISIDTNNSFFIIGLKSNKKTIQLVNYFNRLFDISLSEKKIDIENEMSLFYFTSNNKKTILFDNKLSSKKLSILKQFNFFLLIDTFDFDTIFNSLKSNLEFDNFFLIDKANFTKDIDKFFSYIYSQV